MTRLPVYLGVAFILFTCCLAQSTDKTLQAQATGEDVVDAVIKKITRARVFQDDRGFLKRIACAQTQYGTSPNTYKPQGQYQYYGGIWQLSETQFNDTQAYLKYPGLAVFLKKVNASTGIDWTVVKWSDLWKPMYSGLGARIYLYNRGNYINKEIPDTLAQQAAFFNANYNSTSNVQAFIASVNRCENSTCKGRMDLSIVLDGSGSIGEPDFKQSLGFVNMLIDSFAGATHVPGTAEDTGVRVGFIVYSGLPTTVFTLNETLTVAQRKQRVTSYRYTGGSTYTSQAMSVAVAMFNASERVGVAKVMTVFTDGQANDQVSVGAAEAHAAGISTFAVGIGSGINKAELMQIAQNNPERTFTLLNFDGLTEFFRRMNEETCKIPQTPETGAVTEDVVAKDEKRYFTFAVPTEGLTVTIATTNGSTVAYYSYTDETPSSALNDGVIDGSAHIPYRAPPPAPANLTDDSPVRVRRFASGNLNDTVGQVFISVTGIQENNEYSLAVKPGDTTSGGSGASFANFTILCFLAIFLIITQ